MQDPFKGTAVDSRAELDAMTKAGITHRDMAPIYFSPDLYQEAFEEQFRYAVYSKPAGGIVFDTADDRLV